MAGLVADFNQDLLVNGADLLIWQANYGQAATALTGDANGDGLANGADFLLWQGEYTGSPASLAATGQVVPEPALVLLVGLLATLGTTPRRNTWPQSRPNP